MILRARARSEELGCAAISPGTGALLRVLAATAQARNVVEVGTGAGVSALWLLRGMQADGVLTTIDVEVEHQRAARSAFVEQGVPTSRVRTIPGQAVDVLQRLTDGAYDLVFLDAGPQEHADVAGQALTLLRPGGLLIVNDALWHDRVPDPARRDETTTAARELGKALLADERVISALVPTGFGLQVCVRS